MFGARKNKKWDAEEVEPLVMEMTESGVDPLSQVHDRGEVDDSEAEESSSDDSAPNNPFDDDSVDDDDADEFEPWDDRGPQVSYRSPDAVYTCPPVYGSYLLPTLALIFLFLLSQLAHALVRDVGYHGGVQRVKDELQRQVVWYFVCNWLALIAVGLTLPRKLEVLSDQGVAVGTTFVRYKFDAVRSAQRNASCLDSVVRLRWDFATDCAHRVVVKRAGRYKWEVALSPKDPDEFVQVLRNSSNNDGSSEVATDNVVV